MNKFLQKLESDFGIDPNRVEPVIVVRQTAKYNNNMQAFTQSQSVYSNCAEIIFINTGTSNVLLNGSLLLLPTQAFGGDGKKDELDETVYTIVFQGAGDNNCVVVRKFYNI